MRTIITILLLMFLLTTGCGIDNGSDGSGKKGNHCKKGEFSGDVVINVPQDIEDISGYTSVSGDLSIRNTKHTDLDELSCLESVAGILSIKNNNSLTSMD